MSVEFLFLLWGKETEFFSFYYERKRALFTILSHFPTVSLNHVLINAPHIWTTISLTDFVCPGFADCIIFFLCREKRLQWITCFQLHAALSCSFCPLCPLRDGIVQELCWAYFFYRPSACSRLWAPLSCFWFVPSMKKLMKYLIPF